MRQSRELKRLPLRRIQSDSALKPPAEKQANVFHWETKIPNSVTDATVIQESAVTMWYPLSKDILTELRLLSSAKNTDIDSFKEKSRIKRYGLGEIQNVIICNCSDFCSGCSADFYSDCCSDSYSGCSARSCSDCCSDSDWNSFQHLLYKTIIIPKRLVYSWMIFYCEWNHFWVMNLTNF